MFSFQALISGCIALVLNENVSESSHSVPRLDTPAFPKEFSRAVIKLVGRYLLAIKVSSLKSVFRKMHRSSS